MNPYTHYRQIDLEAIRFIVGTEVSQHSLLDAHNPEVIVEQEARSLSIRLCAMIAGRALGTHTEDVHMYFARPVSWWDLFKEEHPRLCRWFCPPRYWQDVRTEHVTVRVRELFPDVEVLP